MSPKLGLSPDEFCKRAVAYVKGLFDDKSENPGGGPVVQLPFEDLLALRPLCAGLGVAYLVDAGDHFEYVQHRDLRASGLTVDQLHETAVRNLAAVCRKRLEIRKHSNIFAFLMGGNFESSCMLVDELFDRVLSPHVPNGYVAAVPARDLFAVCPRDSAAGVRELRELVDRVWPGGDHLVSKELFVRDAGRWRPIVAEDTAFMFPGRAPGSEHGGTPAKWAAEGVRLHFRDGKLGTGALQKRSQARLSAPLVPPSLSLIKVRRRQGPRRCQCTRCGYDLRARPDRCPKCRAAVGGTIAGV